MMYELAITPADKAEIQKMLDTPEANKTAHARPNANLRARS